MALNYMKVSVCSLQGQKKLPNTDTKQTLKTGIIMEIDVQRKQLDIRWIYPGQTMSMTGCQTQEMWQIYHGRAHLRTQKAAPKVLQLSKTGAKGLIQHSAVLKVTHSGWHAAYPHSPTGTLPALDQRRCQSTHTIAQDTGKASLMRNRVQQQVSCVHRKCVQAVTGGKNYLSFKQRKRGTLYLGTVESCI